MCSPMNLGVTWWEVWLMNIWRKTLPDRLITAFNKTVMGGRHRPPAGQTWLQRGITMPDATIPTGTVLLKIALWATALNIHFLTLLHKKLLIKKLIILQVHFWIQSSPVFPLLLLQMAKRLLLVLSLCKRRFQTTLELPEPIYMWTVCFTRRGISSHSIFPGTRQGWMAPPMFWKSKLTMFPAMLPPHQ